MPLDTAPATAVPTREARRIRVRGLVQGVGFRPFVYRLAHELHLDGIVCNDGEGVSIEAAGTPAAIAALIARLRSDAPPLARVMQVEPSPLDSVPAAGFRIVESGHGTVSTGITPDAAVCAACLDELTDPADRRHRYPFINCTHCGPRFTITAALPYDRPQTSMARFTQCPACQREYDDPSDRRFHAQPNACPLCGPRLWLTDAHGHRVDGDDAIAAALDELHAGRIVALKGLGGFQLVCDARQPQAVALLRARKRRDEKPFAVMAANIASLRDVVRVEAPAAALLEAAAAPIVLLPCAEGADTGLPGIAPGLAELGVMLPTTPLHWLLFHEAAGRPAGRAWRRQPQPLLLVTTSANPGGEPLVIGNDEAVARLGGIADAFVMHDRDILIRCDDSVVRAADDGAPLFIRRARGYTPAPIALPAAGPSVLALGGFVKNTCCLTRGAQAYLSQHIGDLDNAASCEALEQAADHLQRVLELRPQAVAHDLHPDFFGSRLAQRLASEYGVPAIGIQHHHAHIAAICAEHGERGPVLGLALDGVGHGLDDAFDTGTVWGGELLRVDARGAMRLGHLQPLALPGGDRAAREPWRMAAAALHALGRGGEIARRFAHQPAAQPVAAMLARGLRVPPTTSAGRWFDAAAGLLGVCETMNYEGQAAMQLEALARRHGPLTADPRLFALRHESAGSVLDLLPLAARLADERDAARGAALFHAVLAQALADWVTAAAAAGGLSTVALGGGVFLNALLSRQLAAHLRQRGLRVLEARQAPVNDGGLSLGQAWAAIQHLTHGEGA
jgi:hydrogenase maturation protein HypF